ncbi:MAG: TonB-dependent receptor family protein, partial [Bacteroidota bacterium]
MKNINIIIARNIARSILVGFLLSIASMPVQAKQSKVVVTGTVVDQRSGEALPYVSVALKKTDGSILAGQVTANDGQFKLAGSATGPLVLELQFIGFRSVRKELALGEKQIALGTIYMVEESTLLEGVEVRADRDRVEQKADRKVINIGKDLSTIGGSAADIMQTLPTVDVDQDGGVSYRGNSNVRILINGKPSNLDAAQVLQQIPAASIRQIELISNPSAKFNPEGMSGIINIVLYKDTQAGLNANFSSGITVGKRMRTTNSINLNYRLGGFNFYGNYANNQGPSPVWGDLSRSGDNSKEDWYSLLNPTSHLLKLGLDFEWSKRTAVSVYAVHNPYQLSRERSATILFPQNPTQNFGQDYESEVESLTSTVNFNLRHQFAKEGQSLEVEVDHNKYSSLEEAEFLFSEAAIISARAEEIVDIRQQNLNINIDYVHPLNEQLILEVGAEVRKQDAENDFQTTNSNLRDATFDFDRDIYSSYVTIGKPAGKWAYQLGLRTEHFEVIGEFQESGEQLRKREDFLFSLYPSGYLRFTPDPQSQKDVWTINFGRRVDRPGLGQVSPIRVWSSARITNIGNPELVPQFTNSLEINYAKQYKRSSMILGVFLRDIHDEIIRFGFNDPDNEGNIFFSYNNYDRNQSYGIELSGSYKVNDWWNINSSADVYVQQQRAEVSSALNEVQRILSNFRMNHSFKLSDKISAQMLAAYRGPNTNLQYKIRGVYFLNIGARYQIMKGNGTLSLRLNDL